MNLFIPAGFCILNARVEVKVAIFAACSEKAGSVDIRTKQHVNKTGGFFC
jgi:hypothetical protein